MPDAQRQWDRVFFGSKKGLIQADAWCPIHQWRIWYMFSIVHIHLGSRSPVVPIHNYWVLVNWIFVDILTRMSVVVQFSPLVILLLPPPFLLVPIGISTLPPDSTIWFWGILLCHCCVNVHTVTQLHLSLTLCLQPFLMPYSLLILLILHQIWHIMA